LDYFTGNVGVSHDGGTNWQAAGIDMELSESDWLRTSNGSECEVSMPQERGTMRVLENTTIVLKKAGKDSRTLVTRGQTLFDISKKLKGGESFEVETSSTVASVRGTEFFIEGNDERGSCSVVSGAVGVSRNLEIEGDDKFRMEVAKSTEVLVSKDSEVEFNRQDNKSLEKLIKDNRDRPERLRDILRKQKSSDLKRLGPIRRREFLNRVLSRHRAERLAIKKRREKRSNERKSREKKTGSGGLKKEKKKEKEE
jgi:hypothetical protein